jgi:hypothetical protein
VSAAALTGLLRRASDWLVEPLDAAHEGDVLIVPAEPVEPAPPRRQPLAAVVGLARRCGATTIARALAIELADRELGAAVVASPQTPAVVGLGTSPAAARLAEILPSLSSVRAAGRLCLTVYEDPAELGAATRTVAPAVIEVEPGVPAVEAAPVVDRVVLVAPPSLDPRLAAAVAETVSAVADDPLIVVNRCDDHGPWLLAADLLVPESRLGARFALAGRDPRGWLGSSVRQLADMCAGS